MNKNELEQYADNIRGDIKEEQSWQVTYADMMTLLFAFFVLLFSISSIDPVKVSQLKDGMGDKPNLKSFNTISEDFKDIIEELEIEDKAKVSRDPRGVTLEIDGDICFKSGSTILHDDLKKVLEVHLGSPDRNNSCNSRHLRHCLHCSLYVDFVDRGMGGLRVLPICPSYGR